MVSKHGNQDQSHGVKSFLTVKSFPINTQKSVKSFPIFGIYPNCNFLWALMWTDICRIFRKLASWDTDPFGKMQSNKNDYPLYQIMRQRFHGHVKWADFSAGLLAWCSWFLMNMCAQMGRQVWNTQSRTLAESPCDQSKKRSCNTPKGSADVVRTGVWIVSKHLLCCCWVASFVDRKSVV